MVAARLSGACARRDTVGRLGGDEFVVLLELDPTASPELVAERISRCCAADRARRRCDGASSRSRRASGSRSGGARARTSCCVTPISRSTRRRRRARTATAVRVERCRPPPGSPRCSRWTSATRSPRSSLFLLYQPTFDLRSESVNGVEALLRWRHPTRGVIAPGRVHPDRRGDRADRRDRALGAARGLRAGRAWQRTGAPARHVGQRLGAPARRGRVRRRRPRGADDERSGSRRR